MSGIDEQKPEYKCEECDCTNFLKVDYGAITSQIDIAHGVSYPYREGTFQTDDSDRWACRECYTRAPDELVAYIESIIQEVEIG